MYRSTLPKTQLSTRNLVIMTLMMMLWLLLYAQFTALDADVGRGMVSAETTGLIITATSE